MNRTNKLDAVVLVCVVLTMLVAPTQLAVRIKAGPAHTVADIGVSLADIMLAVTALIWGIGVLVYKRWGQLRWPPAAAWVFLLLCVPSVFWAGSFKRSAAELVQYLEYFFVAYLVFVNTLVNRRARIAVLVALLVGLSANTAVAFLQYSRMQTGDPVGIAGLLGNRNIFGAYLCLMVPVAGALTLFARRTWVKIVCAVLALAPMAVMLAGGPFIALLVGIGVLVALRKFSALPIYLAGAFVLILLVLPSLKHNNLDILTDSVFMYNEQGKTEGHRVLKRYLEWQAALKSLDPAQPPYTTRLDYTRKVLLGHGIGVYKNHIERFWGAMPTPIEDIIEPDTQNQYVVLAVSSGFPAALAFVWMLVTFARRAGLGLAGPATQAKPLDKALLVGVLAGLVSVAIAANFALVIVRGVGLILVCLGAMAAAQSTASSGKAANEN